MKFKEVGKKLCLSTLDPFNKGGILSMMEFVYSQSQKNGLSPFLVYNAIENFRHDWAEGKDITFRKLINFVSPKIYKEKFKNMDGFAIERVLPEFEFLNYILNLKQWAKTIEGGDIFFAVGGSNTCALPFVLLKKTFSIWVASTLYEDRIDRIKKENLFRKIRDYISLPVLLYFERLIFKKAQKILALSDYTKNKILGKYDIQKNKIIIVRFPVDICKFHPLNYSRRKNDFILFTGRFNDERKNINILLFAFAKVKKEFSGIKLKLIGGRLEGDMLEIINKFNLKDSIEIVEFIDREELLNYYQNALLFVIPSLQEGLCISGLEALSCGVPVVSTQCGGPEDFIKDGHNGFLSKNDDEEDLAFKIKKFLKLSEKEKKEMAENSRNYILENHSIDKIWEQFNAVLN